MTRRVRLHLAFACIVLLAAIWLSTGTMAPYAVTVESPTVLEPCHYLVSIDHQQFAAPFRMLRGEPFESWGWSVVLRRILFPILALPLVNAFGFLVGGVIASAAIHLIAVAAFTLFVQRRIGEAGAISALWILVTYPGITYWAGLPYSYVVIVPGSLASMMLLYRLQGAKTTGDVIAPALLLGLVFLGYDLLPFFGPAAGLLLLYRRRWMGAVVAGIAMLVPTVLVAATFVSIGIPLLNSNTATYLFIVNAYRHPADLALWGRYIVGLPYVFVSNFLFSNFLALPLLFCAAVVWAWRRRLTVFSPADVALLVATLALFLFNNAAPPYYGWQLRGTWVARLYQPVFPALMLAVARVAQQATAQRAWQAAVALTILTNASIAFGPVLMNPIAAYADHHFYAHSPLDMLVNLRRFGRRPLGVCRTSHEWDDVPNPNTAWNRPAFMFRYPPR